MSSENRQDGIAIIGMAGRFPKARNIAEFWRNLRSGVEAITFFDDKEVEDPRFEPARNNAHYVKARGMLEDADKFDAAFFGINPKEAEVMDPQHRVFLECAWEALEDAGYDSEREERPIGVFAGMSMNTYLLTNLASNPGLIATLGEYQTMFANDKDYLPTRVSYKLNLRGPSLSIQTACSTSLVAVCVACQQLATYQCDMALAGGVSITFPQKKGHFYQEGGIGSPDGHCRAFDAQAQGTVLGEGVGIVVLKRLADALADGDAIYAVIKGFALNNDGGVKAGYTAPSEDGQAEVIALAQGVAGVNPESIQYVVTHGTGTPLGDPIEIAGLTKAFRGGTQANTFCALTSVKTNIGHLDAAAGVAGLIEAVLALKHKEIPPSLHFERPNPKIDFANSPFYVNTRLQEWKRGLTPRRAGVSSFGIGGTNAHVVLEEAPQQIEDPKATEWPQLLVISARTATALENSTARFASFLRENPATPLADVAYTLQTGRRQFSHRRCVVATSAEEAAAALISSDSRVLTQTVDHQYPRVAFMFPGQGAQQVNMGRRLYEHSPVFRDALDECARLLQPHLGEDIRSTLFPAPAAAELAARTLQETRITQPALFVTAFALARLWMSLGVRPESMIGHSIGEYVAACLAGVMSLPDALQIVARRGALMQEMAPGSMLAVRASEEEVRRHLGPGLDLAAVNAPNQCVISGSSAAIEEIERAMKTAQLAAQRLRTSHAFHSAMMDPMLDRFAESLRRVRLNPPHIPFISNVTGTWITDGQATDHNYWVKHLRSTVRFAQGVTELLGDSNRLLLEVGPGQSLAGLARQSTSGKSSIVASLSRKPASEEDRALLDATGELWMRGVNIDWAKIHGEAPRRRVHLPAYPFERKRFWISPGPPQESAVVISTTTTPPPCNYSTDASQQSSSQVSESIKPLRDLFARLSGLPPEHLKGEASFMELGFDSLFLTQASQAIERTFGVRVAFGQLLEKYSTLDLLCQHLESIGPAQNAACRATSTPDVPSPIAQTPAADSVTVPTTEAQREIWYATQRGDASSCVFNETFCLELKGALNVGALARAIQRLADRHEALRASISPDGATLNIAATIDLPLEHVDLSACTPQEREQRIRALLDSEAGRPFDLSRAPLARFHLVRLSEQSHAVIFTGHHIVCDGGSINLITRELGQFYTAECRGVVPELQPCRRFADFAREQAESSSSAERIAAEQYWVDQFAQPVADLELPADEPRPATSSFRAGQARRRIGHNLAQELKRLSAQQGTTLFTTLLSAYYVLLHRLSGQEDLVVGVPASGRGTDSNETMVGHCVNFLPMRVAVEPDAPFTEHLGSVRKKFLQAYDHQSCTFGRLVQRLALPRAANRMPLLSATFNLEKAEHGVRFEGLEVLASANHRRFTNFDLTFDVVERDGELTVQCTYAADLFHPGTIERWLGHFETLLQDVADNATRRISEAKLLSAEEWRRIVVDWNQTGLHYPRDARIHELFEAQAERTPDAIAAVVSGGLDITYRELNRRANQVAHHLRSLGAGPEVLVGLCVERSFALLVGALGILKSGAAYVPLDWTYPPERVRFMLEDTQAPILVAQQSLLQHLPPTSARVVCLDTDWEQIAEHDTANPTRNGDAANLAYVMYTSGSTGVAKGVGLEHRNAVSFIHWAREAFPIEELKAVLASTSICFDLSIFELFVPLSWGGTVVLADNAMQIPAVPPGREISLINTVPSAIKDLLKANAIPSSVVVVNLAGEKLPTSLVRQLYAQPHIQKVYDLYGPSEATTYATWTLRDPNGPATVGRPVANTQIYILDRCMQPCPIGVAGEIYIGGDCLARGYINRPDLTEQKFIPNPFGPANARVYKTGDLGRYLPDGNIEFIGRKDYQVKIRGYRIELGEIETILAQHPGILECVAVVRDNGTDQQQLTAYLVPAPGAQLTAADVRRFLRERLPDYMVPVMFIALPNLPLSPNGKINRAALPAPEAALVLLEEPPAVARLTPVEAAVADIWREVLSIDKVGLHDDFFDLGGHSVLVAQVMSRVRQVFEIELSMRHLFGAPTVAGLAQIIEQLIEEQIHRMNADDIQQLTAQATKETS